MIDNNTIYHHVVVLTGLFASGKSTAAKFFAQLGARIFDADEFARKVVAPNSETLKKLIENFGAEYLLPDGELNRKKLGELVFQNEEKKLLLENILHPAIHQLALQSFKEALKERPPLIIYDCPLFYEAGLNKHPFQAVVVVSSTKEKIFERAALRNNFTAEEIQLRLDSQMPIEEKRTKS